MERAAIDRPDAWANLLKFVMPQTGQGPGGRLQKAGQGKGAGMRAFTRLTDRSFVPSSALP